MTRLTAALLALAIAAPAPAAAAIPTITRTKIIDIAKSGVGCRYIWGGTCWNPANKTWKGADCSGYVTVTWQIPKASKTTDCLPHYYTTSTYTNYTTHWTKISRSNMIKGDALVYNSGSAGHIVLYNSGDKWGSAQVYEARGSAYGIVYRTKAVESKYAARRRNSLGTETPLYPKLTINNAIKTINGQARDLCTTGKSKSIFDWKQGQTTTVNIDVKNSGTAVAKAVKIGLWAEEPYLQVTRWNIYSDWKHPGSFTLNDTDALQSIGHANPAKTFTLNIGAMSVGETKRIVLKVKALKFSVGAADHPDVRAWVKSVTTYYSKSAFDSSATNYKNYQTFNGGDLRTYAQTDVLSDEVCDQKDNDCDGQTDEGNVCGAPKVDSGIEQNGSDAGAAGSDGWTGGIDDTDGGATPPSYPDPNDNSENGRSGEGPNDGCSLGGVTEGASGALPLLALLLLALVRRRRQ
jgi:MYXO-CTERM domain-containing protein